MRTYIAKQPIRRGDKRYAKGEVVPEAASWRLRTRRLLCIEKEVPDMSAEQQPEQKEQPTEQPEGRIVELSGTAVMRSKTAIQPPKKGRSEQR